jgi:flagellin
VRTTTCCFVLTGITRLIGNKLKEGISFGTGYTPPTSKHSYTYRQLSTNTDNQSKAIEKLSSGLRTNRAGDDAASLAISEKMRGQIRGLDQASRNSQDDISMIQTAEGALNETHDILQRMRELSVQSSNGTNTDADRKSIQGEFSQLGSEIDRISTTTEFNTKKLLNGQAGVQGSVLSGTGQFISGTSDTKAGTYVFEVATAATQATTAAGSTDFSTPADVRAKDLSINGVKIDFSNTGATSDTAAVIAKINSYSSQTGVTASGTTNVTLTQNSYGSKNGISLTGAEKAEFGGGVTAGVDVTANIFQSDGTTSIKAGVVGDGQMVTSPAGFDTAGITMKMTGIATSATTVAISQGALSFQIGANTGQNLSLAINEMDTQKLGDAANGKYLKDIDLSTQSGASSAISIIDAATAQVSTERGKLGAYQNRLEHTINNLNTSSENITSAESRIRDVDMAKEMMNQTKNSILAQAAQAMLAQANQQPQGVLQLLR